MSELKTFGQLSIGDVYYAKSKDSGLTFYFHPESLKRSEYKNNYIEILDDEGEFTDLPCDENSFEDDYYIYSTDENEYNKWQVPQWEEEIEKTEKKISELKFEIEELRGKISKVKSNFLQFDIKSIVGGRS